MYQWAEVTRIPLHAKTFQKYFLHCFTFAFKVRNNISVPEFSAFSLTLIRLIIFRFYLLLNSENTPIPTLIRWRRLSVSEEFRLVSALKTFFTSFITFNSKTHHFFSRVGSFKMVATMWAPWLGGFEYMGRTICLSWLRTLLASPLVLHTAVNAPALSSMDKHIKGSVDINSN